MLKPIRQAVRAHLQGYAPKIALGLGLRHDWPPSTRPTSWAPIFGGWGSARPRRTPRSGSAPERFLQTLKEEYLYVHTFRSLEEASYTNESFEVLQTERA